jgi:hypothetical protein
LYETGSSWRESVSDYLSRRFYEEKIVKDKILKDIFIFEECFSSEGEAFLKDAVKDVFERSQGLFSKEEILNDIINNVINGTISPYVYLDKKEVEVLISNKNLKVRIFQKENE